MQIDASEKTEEKKMKLRAALDALRSPISEYSKKFDGKEKEFQITNNTHVI